MYSFDVSVNRRNTFSFKYDSPNLMRSMGADGNFDENTLPLFTADMDFVCADSIREEIQKVVDKNLYGYSCISAGDENHKAYFDAVTGWYKRHYHWEIAPESMIYSPGNVEGIANCIKAFSDPGDGILITPPVYGPFFRAITETGRKVIGSTLLNKDGYYTVNWDDFEKKAAASDTKVYVLCSPHNPTGRIWSDEELIKMYDICVEYGVIVVADEIHGELIRKDKVFHPLATLVDRQNLVSLVAPSKTFNIADLKCANVVIENRELREKYNRTAGFCNPSIFTIAATIGAYNGGEEWLREVREYLDGTIDWAVQFVKKKLPKVRMVRPEGTYILWMDFRRYGLSPDEINKKIAVNANVWLERGEMFGPIAGQGFQRMCVATRRAVIQEAFQRIYRVFEEET